MSEEKGEKRAEDRAAGAGSRVLVFLLATLAVLVVGFVLVVRYAYSSRLPGRPVSLGRLYTLADRNEIKTARLLDEDAAIVGRRCFSPPAPAPEPPAPGARPPRCYDRLTEEYHANYPASQGTQQLIDTIRKSTGAEITVDRQSTKAVAKLVSTFLFPLLLLANLFGLIFLSRGGGESAMGEIARFGRLGRKRPEGERPGTGVTFADVAGADEAVAELREVVDYLTDPGRFEAYGAAPPKGVLLFGPPGCGKTLLARATAGTTGVPFFSVSGTEFVESLVGVGAARVRDLFRQVREVSPAIVFIDEIDAVGRRRSGEGVSGGEREQTLNQLLVELDGFEVTSGIVLMGATNRPDILDPALMRPGRFDRHITMEPPDVEGRHAILELHARGRPIAPDVDFATLAQRTPGFTGADLANVINEAALLAIREGPGHPITSALLAEAVLRVLHGPRRRGRLLTVEERRRLAVHEAGHALVSSATGHGAELHRVSIVARGQGLGQSVMVDGERALFTASELEDHMAMAMAGVAAEELVFGEASTTAEDDVSRATVLAREMAGVYGMSVPIGPVRLLRKVHGYLGADDPVLDLVSGPTMADFDVEVRRLVTAARARASELLWARRAVLDRVVEALIERETLDDAELRQLIPPQATPAPQGNGAGTANAGASRRRSRTAPRGAGQPSA